MNLGTVGRNLELLWTQSNIFFGVLTFSWLVYLWELYLEFRQYNVYKTTTKPPKELETVFDDDTFLKAKRYSIDKARFSLFSGLWSQVQGTITLYFYLMPFFWNLSQKVMVLYLGFNQTQKNEIYQSLIFLLITSFLSTIIDLPLSIYYTFIIEQNHGFNNQTIGFFLWDKTKKFLVSYAIMAPITATIIYIVRNSGPNFFLYLWMFAFVVLLVLVFFQAEIASLFDKFNALPESEIKNKIESLASQVKFPLKNIFVVEGSKRSTHSNAYFTGIFNRKTIVLFDTLIEDYDKKFKKSQKSNDSTAEDASQSQDGSTSAEKSNKKKGCTDDEIIAVLCHELGHWELNHLVKNLLIVEINLFLKFLLFSKCYVNRTLFAAFGFHKEKPVIIGLTLMMMIIGPYSQLMDFLSTALSRHFEYQADYYAKSKGYAEQLKRALIKLSQDNLGFPVYDDLYSKFNHSHPTLIQRLAALSKSKSE